MVMCSTQFCRVKQDLEAENARLREALEFYANPETYKTRGHPQIDADNRPINYDWGKTARAALKESDDAKEGKDSDGV